MSGRYDRYNKNPRYLFTVLYLLLAVSLVFGRHSHGTYPLKYIAPSDFLVVELKQQKLTRPILKGDKDIQFVRILI